VDRFPFFFFPSRVQNGILNEKSAGKMRSPEGFIFVAPDNGAICITELVLLDLGKDKFRDEIHSPGK